ncbi:TonB-dependent siderophore receptor [Corticibacter populi]|nr:TonB-dependent receptor [Corticibacter populi]
MRRTALNVSLASVLEQMVQGCAKGALVAVAAGAFALSVAPVASAQEARAQQGQTRDFDVPAGPLSAALLRFGAQSGLQFNVDSRLTDGKRTEGLRGTYSIEGGLTQLLAGSGLTFRFAGPRTVVIEVLPDAGSTRMLGPLRIEGDGSSRAVAGNNGSTDVTATEGSGSYTSDALSIASKMPLSIKETPQSVSVVTHERIVEQNLTDFSALMAQSTGVSTITGSNGPLEAEFYSRGFRIQRLQSDGGAPLDIASTTKWGMVPQLDMALYDHAEILRGADGLFNGYGDPGGVISLTRKRPLDHRQVVAEVQAGSWSNYRATLDATGPLGLDGRLRGRGILVWQDQDYFYDVAHNEKKVANGVLEYDLTSSTVVSLGVSRTWQDALPFAGGLPRYIDGSDLRLSRDTCLCFPWNSYDFDTTEFYGMVEQELGPNWNLKLNVTRTKQERTWHYGMVQGAVDLVTGEGPLQQQLKEDGASTQTAADFTLSGSFELFGHEQLLVVGANYMEADGAGLTRYIPVDYESSDTPVNVFGFDPSDPAYAAAGNLTPYQRYPTYRSRQSGAYANLRLTFWEPLHLNIGLRYSTMKQQEVLQSLCEFSTGCLDWTTFEPRELGQVYDTYPFGYSTNNFSWPPTFSLVYDVADDVSVYASYSDIYVEQSLMLGHDGKAVDPVTGSNIEAGIKWAARDGRLNATLSAYRIEQEGFAYLDGDLTSPDGGTHFCCYVTDTDLQRVSRGVDVEVTGEILPGWQVAASYTRNSNEETGELSFSNGLPLQSRLPKHLFKLWTSYQFQGDGWQSRLNIGGGINGQSRSYYAGLACPVDAVTGECTSAATAFEFEQGSYAVVSARAGWKLDDRWTLALNINNLLDRTYYQTVTNSSSGNWYGEPRSYTLSLRGQF